MENFDVKFMEAALNEAKLAFAENEVPVGAVMVLNDEIICSDHNRREQLQDPTAHAEMLVIKKASQILKTRRLNACTLYISLEPCPMCAGAMLMANLKSCFFATSDPRQGCIESVYALCSDPSFYNKVKCYGGMMEDEAKSLLKEFFKNKRKIKI